MQVCYAPASELGLIYPGRVLRTQGPQPCGYCRSRRNTPSPMTIIHVRSGKRDDGSIASWYITWAVSATSLITRDFSRSTTP